MNAFRQLCLWSIMLCTIFVSGCGKNDMPTSSANIAGADLRIAIMFSADVKEFIAINNKIRQHMKNSNVNIATYAYTGASLRYTDAMLNDLASKDAPDIIYVPSRAIAQTLDDAGALMALDKVVKDNIPGFDMLLYKSATLIARRHGRIFGIPIDLDPVMVAYNKDHFQIAQIEPDVNWSWDQFAATSSRITAAKSKTNQQDLFSSRYIGAGVLSSSMYSLLPFVYSNGGGYIEDYIINVQSPNTVNALEWLQAHIINEDLKYTLSVTNEFSKKTVSFAFTIMSHINSLNSKDNIYRALPVPKSPRTGQSITIVGGALYVVNAKAKNLDLIADFLKASLNSQVQEYITSKTGMLPVRKDVQMPLMAWMPNQEVMAAMLENGRPIPQPMIGNRPIQILNWNALASGSSTAEEVAKAAATKLQKIVALKDTPAKLQPVQPFFGPISKAQQEPPAHDFKGTKVHWATNSADAIQLVNAFNKAHKDIYVSVTLIDGFKDKGMDERSLSDSSADIVDLPVSIIAIQSYVVGNKILSLDRYLESETAYHSRGFANAIKYKGKTYAIPIKRAPFLAFADLKTWKQIGTPYPQSGWRWDDFITWANKSAATSYTKHGVVFGTGIIWDVVYQQKGGQWSECSTELWKSTLSLLKQLYRSYPNSAYVFQVPSIHDVTQGKAAAYMGLASKITSLDQGSRDTLEKAGLIALPYPTITGQHTGTGTLVKYVVLSAKAPHPDEAAQFIKWLVSKEASLVYASLARDQFPAVMYKENYDLYRTYWGSQVESLFPLEFFPVTGFQRDIDFSISETVDKYLHGKLDMDKAVDAIISQIKKI